MYADVNELTIRQFSVTDVDLVIQENYNIQMFCALWLLKIINYARGLTTRKTSKKKKKKPTS